MKSTRGAILLGVLVAGAACHRTEFQGKTDTKPAPAQPAQPETASVTDVGLTPCSTLYRVPATANPFLAGVKDSESITYTIGQGDGPDPIDRMPAEAPVLVAPIDNSCITAGAILSFYVEGAITYADSAATTDANGFLNQIVSHQKGGLFGKADVTAPLSSLIGVFLTGDDPSRSRAPDALDFSTEASRNYEILQPEVGQIFFIGSGKTTAGVLHKVVVPKGAARLYFGAMDGYQWNNNSGSISGKIMTETK